MTLLTLLSIAVSGCSPQMLGSILGGSSNTAAGSGGSGNSAGAGSGSSAFTGPVNLEVPIEMVDGYGLGSDTTAGPWGRTSTPVDARDYDGTTSYFFEVNARNISGASRTVTLEDTSSTVYATVSIPVSATQVRVRAAFSTPLPTGASTTLRVRTPGTGVSYQLLVMGARVLIQQTNATKTKLYIPLLNGASVTMVSFAAYNGAGPATEYDGSIVNVVSTTAYTVAANQPIDTSAYYPIWKKVDGAYSELAGATPWTFQAMVIGGGTASSRGSVALWDRTSASAVAVATNTAGLTPELISVPLSDAALVDGHFFDIRARNNLGGANNTAVHKAGLWVTLQNLTKGEVFYRVGRGVQLNPGTNATPDRVLADFTNTNLFTLPRAYFESTFWCTGGACGNWLIDDGGVTEGMGPGSVVAGTTINNPTVAFASRIWNRSGDLVAASAVSKTQINNYITGVDPGASTVNLDGSFLVVGFGK